MNEVKKNDNNKSDPNEKSILSITNMSIDLNNKRTLGLINRI